MHEGFSPFASLNRVIHEPARLAILSVLSACESADFLFLQSVTGLSKGNLSVQVSRLEEAGLINVEKVIHKKRTLTTMRLTAEGQLQMKNYWDTMDAIRQQSVVNL
jgi:DNA-binding transcriptional ArsR family regulator